MSGSDWFWLGFGLNCFVVYLDWDNERSPTAELEKFFALIFCVVPFMVAVIITYDYISHWWNHRRK